MSKTVETQDSTIGHPEQSLEALLAKFARDPATRSRSFSKADLVELVSCSFSGDSAAAVELIRLAAKGSGALGSTKVVIEGERRGTKYSFRPVNDGEDLPQQKEKAPKVERESVLPGGIRDFPSPECPSGAGPIEVLQGDNLELLRTFPDSSFDLIYVDPPFNTGHAQARTRIKTERDDDGDRVGFKGRRYRTTVVGSSSYTDTFDDYMAFLVPRLEEAFRILKPTGSFFLHLDYREVHYAKIALDQIFGRDSFINEIIWSYDYGARATNRWSPKHDNILWYAKSPKNYCFNYDEIDRIPYMAPSLVGEEKAERGKTPTDAWWNTIVSPNGKEKTGYPTQKPLGILTRIVRVHSKPGDQLLDFFAGSGSFGEAAANFGRKATLIDENPEAIEVMRRRFANFKTKFIVPGKSETEQTIPPASGVETKAVALPSVERTTKVVDVANAVSKGVQRTGSAPTQRSLF